MAYEDPIFDYEDAREEENEEKRGRGCFPLLSILIVVVMVGISIPSLLWLYSLREAASEPIVVTVEVSATPRPTTVREVPYGSVTAVTTPAPLSEETTAATMVNRIAYVNIDGQIVTIKPDGTDAHILTTGNQRFQFPAWSPDSSRLASVGQNNRGGAVYVIDANAEKAEPDYVYQDRSEDPFYLYWAPDGQQIGFIVNDSLTGIALHVVPADGSTSSRIVSGGVPFYWHWADDSQRMLVHIGGSGFRSRLEMVTVGDDISFDTLGNPGYFQSPGISVDGRYLAFAESTNGGSQITIVDAESGVRQEADHFGLAAINWSPTDPLLAYVSGNSPDSESFVGPLRLMDAETGEVTLLSRDKVVAFFWSPNGQYIAALSFVDPGLDRDVNAARPKPPLSKPAAQFRLPELELVIFDVTTMEGREMLRFVPTFPFLSQFLPFFDQYALSHNIWSPQSDALVLPMLGEDFNQIVVVSIASGEERVIAEGTMPFWSLR